jgi:primary-amine oxidase
MTADVQTLAVHPLDPLTAEEIARAVAVIHAETGVGDRTLFGGITLVEPDKRLAEVPVRRAEAIVYDRDAGRTYQAIVALAQEKLETWTEQPGVQPALLPEEYLQCEQLTKAHPDFIAALARRGIDDLELVCVDPMPTGNHGLADDAPDRRMLRTLAYVRPDAGGNNYARPIEGVIGVVDLGRGEVVRIDDFGVVPLPAEEGEYRTGRTGPMREDVRPIEITQPEGPSFTVEGNEVHWQKWRLRIGFTPREGLVLHTVGYEDGGRLRPVLHRASFAEMAVR